MTQITDSTHTVASTQQRRNLAQITGAAGLVTLVVVLGTSLANDYQSAAIDSNANETVAFFRSLDDTFGAISSFLTAVGLIAMLWFTLGLALLLRRYEGELPWRSVFLAGAGVVSVVSGQIASWDAAVYRSDDIDPQVARYAFDLGNLSFANSWVAAGAVGICTASSCSAPASSRTGSAGGPSSLASARCSLAPSGPRATRSSRSPRSGSGSWSCP